MDNLNRIVPTDEPHLSKNLATGVVLNNDDNAYQAYLAQRSANEAKRQQVMTLEQEVDTMKEDIAEIKNLLRFLIEKK
jgi:hypothetical protein